MPGWTRRAWALGPLASCLVLSCALAWDDLDPRLGGSGGSGGSGASGGASSSVGGAGGTGGTAAGTPSGIGGAPTGMAMGGGGMGGAPVLVSRGLLTRYYLDEADMGMGPSAALDAAPNPLDLPIDYGDLGGVGGGSTGMGGFNVSYTEVSGQRGLAYAEKNVPGGPSVSVSGTKLLDMNGLTTGTIEVVADVQSARGSAVCTRLSHLGVNTNGAFTLCVDTPTVVSLRFNGQDIEAWTVPITTMGRTVLHGVLDTGHVNPMQRARLFVNGVALSAGDVTDVPPTQDAPIALSSGRYVLGNRIGEDGSPVGSLFYAALYTTALTDGEIANNSAILTANDDTP